MKRLTTEDFIKKAEIIHKNKYDYSKVKYKNAKTKVCIICPEHGEFWQVPYAHNDQKQGCPKCAKRFENERNFIEEFKKIHGDKYDYSETEYRSPKEKIRIICKNHGVFYQRFDAHLSGQGCPYCKAEKISDFKLLTTEEFIEKAKEIHGDKYDYSEVEYVNSHKNVKIICKKHGIFEQKPNGHLIGRGCPKCSTSKLEEMMRHYLTENNILFEEQKTFDWLVYKGKLKLDFFLPKYNIAIECQGGQHFIPVDYAGLGKEWAEKQLIINQHRDKVKKELCESNGVEILYFTDKNKDFFKLNI